MRVQVLRHSTSSLSIAGGQEAVDHASMESDLRFIIPMNTEMERCVSLGGRREGRREERTEGGSVCVCVWGGGDILLAAMSNRYICFLRCVTLAATCSWAT